MRQKPHGGPIKKSQYTDEQIVKIVRESHEHGVQQTARKYNVSENTLYIWRRKLGGMEPSQVAELKRLAQENSRLKKLVAERDPEIDLIAHLTTTHRLLPSIKAALHDDHYLNIRLVLNTDLTQCLVNA